MRKVVFFVFLVVVFSFSFSFAKDGNISLNTIFRLENQKNASCNVELTGQCESGQSDPTAYAYNMFFLSSKVWKSYVASGGYIYQYNLDEKTDNMHIISLSLARTFKEKYTVMTGYSHIGNRTGTSGDEDKLLLSLNYAFTLKNCPVKYNLSTTYSTKTSFSSPKTLGGKISASYNLNKKVTLSSAINLNFSKQEKGSDFTFNQYSISGNYKISQDSSIALEYNYTDFVEGMLAPGVKSEDNNIIRLSYIKSFSL